VNAGVGIPYADSWFARQAAELGLKALYIERAGILAPRTHDLVRLGALVGAPPSVGADFAVIAAAFDAWCVTGRGDPYGACECD
jgi:HEPN domain-containing protein